MTNPILNIADAPAFLNQPEGSTMCGSIVASISKVAGREGDTLGNFDGENV